jgi:signal transduction histidine kinase/sugar phosphate isomerase/epimerase
MKVGFQTILWGRAFADIKSSLNLLSHFHFQGIEVFQTPLQLPEAPVFGRMLQDYGLELVGLAGGTVEERLCYCGGILKPLYFYVESFDQKDADLAGAAGIPLALHPHVFARVHRLKAAMGELAKHPELQLLPDTAHLAIAGDDSLDAIRRGWGRLASVHLKDWTPVYGRSVHRYAKGFTELGNGRLAKEIDAVVFELRRRSYEGWLIVEQDSSVVPPEAAVQISANWLADDRRHLLPKAAPVAPAPKPACLPRPPGLLDLDVTDFLRELATIATTSGDQFYWNLAREFDRLIPCRFVSVWSYSPAHHSLAPLAYYPSELNLDRDLSLERGEALSSVALDSRQAEVFDFTISSPGAPYGRPNLRIVFPQLVAKTHAKELWTLPILNCNNPNQVRFLLNFSPQASLDPAPWRPFLAWLAPEISRAADVALEEHCSYAAATVNLLQGGVRESNVFIASLIKEIARITRSQGCSIFLVSETGDRLECAGSTGIEWHVPEDKQFYLPGQGLTGKCLESEECLIVNHAATADGFQSLSTEKVAEPERDSAVFVPLKHPGPEDRSAVDAVLGVIRCRTKARPNCFYSDDDVAVIEAMAQAAIPHIVALQDEERRIRALLRLTHELRTPLVAIGGALDLMEDDLERYFHGNIPDIFTEDYLGDVSSWRQLMDRLLENADLVSGRLAPIQIEPSRTLILKDVLAAAIRQVDRLCKRRRFRAGHIQHGPFDQIPALYIDRNLFQQAFFNLLSNAIKYAYADPEAFSVEVLAKRVPDGFELLFRDWGTGVDPASARRIFELGVRGRDRTGANVAGQGIGLWVVRRVAEAHGGRVWLSSPSQPTEFTIFMPAALEQPDRGKNRRVS